MVFLELKQCVPTDSSDSSYRDARSSELPAKTSRRIGFSGGIGSGVSEPKLLSKNFSNIESSENSEKDISTEDSGIQFGLKILNFFFSIEVWLNILFLIFPLLKKILKNETQEILL